MFKKQPAFAENSATNAAPSIAGISNPAQMPFSYAAVNDFS
ncbi:hypothetical protein [Methanimicrococcus stummii]|nr:hypothetical protein [Methanimicrococcus sp. Es2]